MAANTKQKDKNPQIKKIREEIESLKSNEKFSEMSKAFRDSVAKRLGLDEFHANNVSIEAKIPVPLKGILENAEIKTDEQKERLESLPIPLGCIMKAAGINSLEELRKSKELHIKMDEIFVTDPGRVGVTWPEPPYDYVNVYSYTNW